MDFLRRYFFDDTGKAEDDEEPSKTERVSLKRSEKKLDIRNWDRIKRFFRFHWKGCMFIITPIILSPILTNPSKEAKSGFVFALVVIYWVTECLPVIMTSMIPIVLLPLLGISDSDETCRSYFRDTTFALVGGITIALSVEYSNLHRRLALTLIKLFSCYPRRLHMGLMFITYSLSHIMSNTVTAALMCLIVRAVLEILSEEGVITLYEKMTKKDTINNRNPSRFSIAFYLGTAYSATIGGLNSLIGSGTNLAFKYEWERIYEDFNKGLGIPVDDFVEIKNVRFFAYGLPISILLLCSTYLYLEVYLMGLWRPNTVMAKRIEHFNQMAKIKEKVFKDRYRNQNKITCHEISIIVLIVILLILYLTRSPDWMPGWVDITNKQ